ncbi:MAG: type II toxin-antitoxin system RelE family toxin [Thermomicrobiales bacterium]
MKWEIVWSRPAEHDLRRLDQDVARRIFTAIDQLAETGHGDIRPLHGKERQWRLRVGDRRVIFVYDASASVIRIVRVLPRDRAYRDT